MLLLDIKPTKKAANNLTKKNHAIAIQVDVSSRKSIKKGIQTCKKFFGQNIDVLINNAAISQEKSFEKISDADWDHMLALKSAWRIFIFTGSDSIHDQKQVGTNC